MQAAVNKKKTAQITNKYKLLKLCLSNFDYKMQS